MAQTNTFNTRIQHKHDVEANWLKATTFAPKAGELIIYDVDETHSSPRFKVGDGTTLVTNLPFSSATPEDLGEALLKTGDTMEGILKFTKNVHYGEDVPDTGEEGQIFFQVGETFIDTIEDGSITRAKLATDVLYSPMVDVGGYSAYEIKIADIGKTLKTGWQKETSFTITQANSTVIPLGAEIAIYMNSTTPKVTIVGSGVRVAVPGEQNIRTNGRVKITICFGMVALKKVSYNATEGDVWLVTGPVEVVS